MEWLPDPLHPAVVHFPIALLMVGALLSLVAVLWRRWLMPSALLLALGAVGASAAVATGAREEDRVGRLHGEVHEVMEAHEEVAERTRFVAILAAVVAVAACVAARVPVLGRLVALVSACVALAAAWHVAEAGRLGGELVYRHGVGIRGADEGRK